MHAYTATDLLEYKVETIESLINSIEERPGGAINTFFPPIPRPPPRIPRDFNPRPPPPPNTEYVYVQDDDNVMGLTIGTAAEGVPMQFPVSTEGTEIPGQSQQNEPQDSTRQ